MGRSTRKYAILAKIQPTAGTDSVPTGGANAMLVSNVQVNPLVANNVDRNLLRTYYGSSEQLIGSNYKELSFDVEICGGASAGSSPASTSRTRGSPSAVRRTSSAVPSVDPSSITRISRSGTRI